MAEAQAGTGAQAQAAGQHPAAVDPRDVAEGRHQRQRDELRKGHQQHHGYALQGAVAADLGEEFGRHAHARAEHHQHAGQGDQGEGQVAALQQLQAEERQRVAPFVDQEQPQQEAAAAQQQADQRRLEPVQAFALQQTDHQGADRREAGEQADAVELAEAFQAHRVLGDAMGHRGHRHQAQWNDLPEHPLPADVFEPERRQWQAQVGPEGRGEGIGAQAIELYPGWQEA